MITLVRRLSRDERGTAALEYGLILALVVIAMLVALRALAGETEGLWSHTLERTDAATSGMGN